MLKRKAEKALAEWKSSRSGQALLVSGARQVGKTFLIDRFIHDNYQHVVMFDLVDQIDVRDALNAAHNSQDLFLAMSAYAGADMVPGETVIFIDEIQECPEALTLIKYLVQRSDFDYILSGSLLGVELNALRSAPIGYLRIVDMYPLDFEEFCWACGLGQDAWNEARNAFAEQRPVFDPVHERMLTLFHHYLLVGGMPQAVNEFIDSHNIALVQQYQNDILRLYRYDISKYAQRNKQLVIREIFDEIPAQLNSQSKRFNFTTLAPKGTYERYRDDFLWLVDAGIVIVARNVSEPRPPLRLAEDRSFFKLFMNDVGLLSAACGMEAARDILSDNLTVNYGSIYENVVAQELFAHGSGVYFFRNRNQGELDFVIESQGEIIPLEVKSGKNYRRHSALNNVLNSGNYGIRHAIVLCEDNVSAEGNILYCPVYMVAFIAPGIVSCIGAEIR